MSKWRWIDDDGAYVLVEEQESFPFLRIILTCGTIDLQDRNMIEKSHNLFIELDQFVTEHFEDNEWVTFSANYIHSKIKEILGV